MCDFDDDFNQCPCFKKEEYARMQYYHDENGKPGHREAGVITTCEFYDSDNNGCYEQSRYVQSVVELYLLHCKSELFQKVLIEKI
jgi:hypothetical protein